MNEAKTILLPPTGEEGEVLPPMRPYIEINSESNDALTTEADLNIINNYLEVTSSAIGSTKGMSIGAMSLLAKTAVTLIEARRKVKKLPYGTSTSKDAPIAKRRLVVID
jgi:hypothetical protein